jgi:threonine dehydrogenase-like Zn-dependent dehydrogenase
VKALVAQGGRPVYVEEYPPPEPDDGEVVIQVLRAGICATDIELLRGYMNFTGVLGHEFCGRVVAGSETLKGKRVVAEINCVCGRCDMCRSGLSSHCRDRTVLGIKGRDGAMAEHVCLPERNCHVLPDRIGDEDAVFVEPLAAAFQIAKQVPIDERTRVAVLGSGRLGLLVAQVLSGIGCQLLVVGRNPKTLEYCERWRINSRHVDDVERGRDFDVVVEATGSPAGFEIALEMIRPRGTLVLKSTTAGAEPLNLAPVVIDEIVVVGSRCGPFPDAIEALAAGRVEVSSMITKTFPLRRGQEAFEAAERPDQVKVLLDTTSP